MSGAAFQWVWDYSRSRNGARLVMLAIAARADDDGIAWPSVAEIKRMAGLSERAVQNAITSLSQLGELDVAYNHGGVSLYQVNTGIRYPHEPVTLRPKRPPIPLKLRLAVYERDGWACVECGSADDLTLDHLHPWSLGGEDTYENLRALCRPCNSRKGAQI